MEGEAKQEYFREALGDFSRDVAYGKAVEFQALKGYTVKQIREALDYPVSEASVRRVYVSVLEEHGILAVSPPFPEEDAVRETARKRNRKQVLADLEQRTDKAESCWLELPFLYRNERWKTQAENCLTNRELEYLFGLFYEERKVFHILDERMKWICVELIAGTEIPVKVWIPGENLIWGNP